MVAQEPKTIAPDFSGSEPIPVGMKAADAAGGGDGGHHRAGRLRASGVERLRSTLARMRRCVRSGTGTTPVQPSG